MDTKDKDAILNKIEELENMIKNRERWIMEDRLTVQALRSHLDTEKGASQ